MKRFGQMHYAAAKENIKNQADAEEEAGKKQTDTWHLEEGDKATRALQVVRELHARYEKQAKRWEDYTNLFYFLIFVALFLAVLYLQRNAQITYQVHSTIAAGILPGTSVMKSLDAVMTWLKSLLASIWRDPVCGDGICETPFEFASYGRFGCRADCGKLAEVQDLTSIQIDIVYNFNHPLGSISGSELMNQAAFNLCPRSDAPHGKECYFVEDQTFDKLEDTMQLIITDVPDGEWELSVKRDFFRKVKGGVRVRDFVAHRATDEKINLAWRAAKAEQDWELNLLNSTIAALEDDNRTDLVVASKMPTYTAAIDAVDTDFGLGTDAWNKDMYYATKNCTEDNRDIFFDNYHNAARKCADLIDFGIGDGVADNTYDFLAEKDCGGLNVTDAATGAYEVDLLPLLDDATFCETVYNETRDVIDSWFTGLKEKIYLRMGSRTLPTSKAFYRVQKRGELLTQMAEERPELIEFITSIPTGRLPKDNPDAATLSDLAELFVNGPRQRDFPEERAFEALLYRSQLDSLTHKNTTEFIYRLQGRVEEIEDARADVLMQDPLYTELYTGEGNPGPPLALTRLYQAQTFIRDPQYTATTAQYMNATTNTWQYKDYNKVTWYGAKDAYKICNLEQRQPAFAGTCKADETVGENIDGTELAETSTRSGVEFSCEKSSDSQYPWKCRDYTTNALLYPLDADGNPVSDYVDPDANTLTFRTTTAALPLLYNADCVMTCDRRTDCAAICECQYEKEGVLQPACTSRTSCMCAECEAMEPASAATEFADIQNSIEESGANAAGRRRERRQARRLQATETDLLTDVLEQVGTLRVSQDALTGEVQTLQNKVDTANEEARARAADTTLKDLIIKGREDISAGQTRVETLLEEIIGKQNQAMEAAEQAQAALNAIESLAEKQAQAQAAVQAAVDAQLNAIKKAASRSLITEWQALELWKRARRDRKRADKNAALANIPCTSLPVEEHAFVVSNYDTPVENTARERHVGLTNRVIAGMLLHTTRTQPVECPDSRFNKIENECSGGISRMSYGVDPVFKMGTTLFDEDKIDPEIMTSFYNCDELDVAEYDFPDPYDQNDPPRLTNQAPFCLQLYNMRDLPYGFRHFPLNGYEDGFPVWIDINLSEYEAEQWYQYLEEGLYLDADTRTMTMQLVTYNAELRIFSSARVTFTFTDGGSVRVSHKLHTTKVELYETQGDIVRLVLEILLSACIFFSLCMEIKGIALKWRQAIYARPTWYTYTLGWLKYFTSAWTWVDAASTALMTACMIIWWVFVLDLAKNFDIQLRYNVYENLRASAFFLKLQESGKNLIQANEDFLALQGLVDRLAWYYAINGINILLLIARVLKLMDFQPRLGVVTRSLALAGPDLLHFCLVCGMVFIGYAMMAHLIFGNAIEGFSTFAKSVDTCFEILLGEIGVYENLKSLSGLQGLAGTLFFWTFELLVFMVLLNFLLAIIVDAFSEVKENTAETTGIHTEIGQMLQEKWRSMLGRFFNSHHIPDKKLGQLLKQWAGEEADEADDKPERDEDGTRTVKVLGEELTEDELKEVLLACYQEVPMSEQEARAGCMGIIGKREAKSDADYRAELEEAAKYVVARFGTSPDSDDEDEDGEDEDGDNKFSEMALEKERDQLATALERLAEVQRELAEGQRSLMAGQKQLADQQARLVGLMQEDTPGPSGPGPSDM